MKIERNKAIKLIDKKICEFQKVIDEATYNNRYNEAYELAYHGAENLLTELFSKEEAMKFRGSVSSLITFVGRETNYEKDLEDYRKHINRCIIQLKVYKERIENFWPNSSNSADKINSQYVIKKLFKWKNPWFKYFIIPLAVLIIGAIITSFLKESKPKIQTKGDFSPGTVSGGYKIGDVIEGNKITIVEPNKNNSLTKEKIDAQIRRVFEDKDQWMQEEIIKLPQTQKKTLDEDSFNNPYGGIQGSYVKHQLQVLSTFIKNLDNKLVEMDKEIENIVMPSDLKLSYLDSEWIKNNKKDIISQYQNTVNNEVDRFEKSIFIESVKKNNKSYSARNELSKELVLKYIKLE
ncbi:MAG: hypothetical protein NT145_01975 [Elusimicrobia bacterium]|nr:hypothetical protein [Elusimicrobiota bacterium]